MGSIRALFKFAFTFTGLLLIGIAVLAIVFAPRLEGLIKQRIEHRMTAILGADVSIESLKWAPWQGKFAMVGLRIQNPDPFPPEPVFHAAQVTLHIDVPTIFSEAPRIEEILIEGAEFHVRHQSGDGLNLLLLVHHAREYSRSSAGQEGRAIRVGAIRWDEGLLRISPGLPVPIHVPPYTVEGIGDTEGGIAPSAMMAATFQVALRRAVTMPGIPGTVSAILGRFLEDGEAAGENE